MSEFEEVGPPLTEEHIASFERELGVRLPDPYRRFLLRTNGGRPPREKDTVDVEGLSGSPTGIQVFYRIGGAVKSSELTWNRETLCERIPDNLLAIASDSFGSDFCISLKGEDRGAIYFCDLQSVAFNYEAVPNFYPVASDFDAFMNKLREFRDEESPQTQE